MAKLILLTSLILILVNTLTGLLLSNYMLFNWLSVDFVLVINTILSYRLSKDNISKGFKICLSFVYPFLGFISIILAILSSAKFQDNYYIIGFIVIMLIKVSLYLIVKNIKTINNN